VTVRVRAEERTFRGERVIALTSGSTTALFAPGIGMTGVSLRHRGGEHLALPGGLDRLRAGHSAGLPLLAPWANRLAGRRYKVGRHAVDFTGVPVHVDEHGLPIHGLLLGTGDWCVDALTSRRDAASLTASILVDSPAFPFPHRIVVTAIVRDGELRVDTTLVPAGRRAVPVSFGWHPYLRLPGTPRRSWRLRLPARRYLEVDGSGIPTGVCAPAPAEADPIGSRTLDAGYALGRGRTLAITNAAGRSVELHCGPAYSYAQAWVPPAKPFVALEPMTAPVNALVTGEHASVREPFTATFTLSFDTLSSHAPD
jgi:galactose mutarotase-like enzyme